MQWFEKLCNTLKNKYKLDPVKVYDELQKQQLEAQHQDGVEDEDEGSVVGMEPGLRLVLEQKLGRAPTDAEMQAQLVEMKTAVAAKLAAEVPASS